MTFADIDAHTLDQLKTNIFMRYAVLVPIIGEHFDDHVTYKWVTSIDWDNKTWLAENKKPAYFFTQYNSAQDFCIKLAYNNTVSYVVEVLEGVEPINNF